MNQQCKVCGEPAAGFHFGAFTCEGCKSFFGRSYNNLSSISECKNNGECVINKKNRTSCKACRLRKCLLVGMSKSGSRYGRRSNWFKIHCLLQEQQAAQQRQTKTPPPPLGMLGQHPFHHQLSAVASAMSQHHHGLGRIPTKDDLMLFGLDDYKNSTSPSISSPESHNSDSSAEVSESKLALRNNFFFGGKSTADGDANGPNNISKDVFVPLPFASLASLAPVFPHSAAAAFLPTPAAFAAAQQHPILFPPNSYLYHQQPKTPNNILKTNNNNRYTHNHNDPNSAEMYNKRFFLDAVLQSQRSPTDSSVNKEEDELVEETETEDTSSPSPSSHHAFSVTDQLKKMVPISKIIDESSIQESPIDLSMKGCRIQNGRLDDDRRSFSGRSNSDVYSDQDEFDQSKASSREEDDDTDFENSNEIVHHTPHQEHRTTPMDLTTKA